MRLLLGKGSDPNTANKLGNTPLHYAVDLNHMGISDLLLQFGANEKIKNSKGLRPWEGIA